MTSFSGDCTSLKTLCICSACTQAPTSAAAQLPGSPQPCKSRVKESSALGITLVSSAARLDQELQALDARMPAATDRAG